MPGVEPEVAYGRRTDDRHAIDRHRTQTAPWLRLRSLQPSSGQHLPDEDHEVLDTALGQRQVITGELRGSRHANGSFEGHHHRVKVIVTDREPEGRVESGILEGERVALGGPDGNSEPELPQQEGAVAAGSDDITVGGKARLPAQHCRDVAMSNFDCAHRRTEPELHAISAGLVRKADAELVGVADLIGRVMNAAGELTADRRQRRLHGYDLRGRQAPEGRSVRRPQLLPPGERPLESRGIANDPQRPERRTAILNPRLLPQAPEDLERMEGELQVLDRIALVILRARIAQELDPPSTEMRQRPQAQLER